VRHTRPASYASSAVPGIATTWEVGKYVIEWYRVPGPMVPVSAWQIVEGVTSWIPVMALLVGGIWIAVFACDRLVD